MIDGDTLTINAFWTSDKFFPTEQPEETEIGRIFHDYYLGSETHLGWMDLVQLRTTIQKNKISHLVLQNLDVLGEIVKHTKELKICNAYLYDGRVFGKLPKKVYYHHCHPLYGFTRYNGWNFTENSTELPYPAESYMRYLLIHTKVESISYYTSKFKFTAYWRENGCTAFKAEKI